MSSPGPCPEYAQLVALSRGDLAGETLDRVQSHVSSCPDCESRLAAINQREPVTASVSSATATLSRPGPGDPPDHPPVTDPPAVLGKYRLTAELGRGGMGAVYAAVHTNLNRRVAVKVILPEYADNPRVVARFVREIRAVGELEHPNIVTATDADQADGWHFLVMELIDGLDLSTLVRRVGPLPVAAACEAVRQAAVGLQYIHERGLVHRDLKPSNLMLSADGVVKVLDLGLAALRDPDPQAPGLTATLQVMGTPDYMAPEQWADTRTVDIRADIYSLGCALYHLLAGRPPFGGSEHAGRGRKELAHAEMPPPPLASRRPAIPAGLEDVLNRMLAKQPDDRFAVPGLVAEALAPFAAGADCRALVAAGRAAGPGDPADQAETVSRPPARVTVSTMTADQGRRRARWVVVSGVILLAAGLSMLAGWAVSSQTVESVTVPKGVETPLVVDRGPQPGEWYPCLRNEPVKLVWHDPRFDHDFRYIPGRRELRLEVPSFALVGFGRTDYAGYRIQLFIQQVRWVGGVGLFFGLHDAEVAGKPCRKCQVLELKARQNAAPRNGFVMERYWATVETADGVPRLTRQVVIESAEFDTPVGTRQHMLAIEVSGGRLTEVRWDEKPFPTLVASGLDDKHKLTRADYVGAFGAFCRRSQGVFGDAQLMTYERARP